MSKNLEQRVEDVLTIARESQPWGADHMPASWERRMKAAIAQVFFLGMGVGWDKCVASMDDKFRDLTSRPENPETSTVEVTGTVASVRRMRTKHGSTFIRAVVSRPGTHDIPLTWLHGFEPVPARGQRVTITGMAMMTRPRKGSYRTNISIGTITIHEDEESP